MLMIKKIKWVIIIDVASDFSTLCMFTDLNKNNVQILFFTYLGTLLYYLTFFYLTLFDTQLIVHQNRYISILSVKFK